MSVTSEEKVIYENGENKDGVAVYFTNGALQQLQELKTFFNAPSDLDTIKIAISFLQQIKEQRESAAKKPDSEKK